MLFAIAGPISSGKGTIFRQVLEKLRQNSVRASYVEADALCHALYAEDRALQAQLAELFGSHILQNEVVDRAALGRIVFADPAQLARLNATVWPHIWLAFERFVAAHSDEVVLFEAAVLFSAGWAEHFDVIFVVQAEKDTCKRRAMQARRLDEELFERIWKVQQSSRVPAALEDKVVYLPNNSESELQPALALAQGKIENFYQYNKSA